MARRGIFACSLATAGILLSFSRSAYGSPSSGGVAAADCRPIDLSHPFDENTIYWPGMKPFRFTRKVVDDPGPDGGGIFYTANEFEASEHGGTHLDAPYHFYKYGWKVADIPVEHLVSVDGIMLDARKEAACDPDYGLTAEKLVEWERNLSSPIAKPTVIVINYGWAKKYPKKREYYGSDTLDVGDLHFPGVSKEAADRIAADERVVGVGLDTASVDRGGGRPAAHLAINGANKYILENMALDGVGHLADGHRFKLHVSPMKIKHGSGAPCRIFAVDGGCLRQ